MAELRAAAFQQPLGFRTGQVWGSRRQSWAVVLHPGCEGKTRTERPRTGHPG